MTPKAQTTKEKNKPWLSLKVQTSLLQRTLTRQGGQLREGKKSVNHTSDKEPKLGIYRKVTQPRNKKPKTQIPHMD